MSPSTPYPSRPTLRLVYGDGAPKRDPVAPRPVAREGGALPIARRDDAERIARENVAAVSLAALDPRWVLAVQASRELQGGKAAIITPEKRKRLMLVAGRLGLRPFDANLVIAIVQDSARCGTDPLGSMSVQRLHLVRGDPELDDARAGPTWGQVAMMVIAAGVFGAAAALVAVLLSR